MLFTRFPVLADRNLQGKNSGRRTLAKCPTCTLRLCSLLSYCFHASAQEKEPAPPDFGNTPGIPGACRRVAKTLPGDTGDSGCARAGFITEARDKIGTVCRGKKPIRCLCPRPQKGAASCTAQALQQGMALQRRSLLFAANDSLDSSGEGRPRAAEVENPNQNKAICTSQTGLALLIN